MRTIKRWGWMAVLLFGLIVSIASLAAAQGSGIPVALDDQYGLILPAGYQIAQQEQGFLAAGTSSIGLAIYSPALVSAPAGESLLSVLVGAGNALMPNSILSETDAVMTQIDGRDLFYIDTTETFQGQSYNVRLHALRMTDGTVGVVNVIALSVSTTPADHAAEIDALLASFDVLSAAPEGTEDPSAAPTALSVQNANAASPEPTKTPEATATPTITPTPGPLMPQEGGYTLAVTGSDGEATCSVGFYPLETVLGLSTYSGSLVASNDGSTVDFTVGAAADGAGDRNRLHLERQSNTNQFTGTASDIESSGGVRWSVDLHMELVAPGRFSGYPTGSFTMTDGQNTIRCADNATILLQTN